MISLAISFLENVLTVYKMLHCVSVGVDEAEWTTRMKSIDEAEWSMKLSEPRDIAEWWR